MQDGLYLKVDSHNINNFTRGSWKRKLKQFGKVSCRHVGCSVESKTFEETLEHHLNCPMAPKKVNITKPKCKVLTSYAEGLRSKTSWILGMFPLFTLIFHSHKMYLLCKVTIFLLQELPRRNVINSFVMHIIGLPPYPACVCYTEPFQSILQPISTGLLLTTFITIPKQSVLKTLIWMYYPKITCSFRILWL
jgi:hypothetical protein